MPGRLKIAILTTWKEEGEWDLYRDLKKRVQRIDIFGPAVSNKKGASLFNRLSEKWCPFYIPWIAFRRRRQYDAIFSWSTPMGLCYALINRFWGKRPDALHVLRDFHINLEKKGVIYRFKIWLLRWALSGVDFFLTTSVREERIYSRMFGIAPQKIRFYPDSPSEDLFKPYRFEREDYIFAYGNSDRDFDILIKAAAGFKEKVVILSQAYRPRKPLPAHFRLLCDKIPETEMIRLIGCARLVVLPFTTAKVAAGQNSMIETMALGRPLVVSTNLATSEYARHGESALFFEAHDAAGLARHIRYLWDHPEAAEKMGAAARKAIRPFPQMELRIFYEVVETLFGKNLKTDVTSQ